MSRLNADLEALIRLQATHDRIAALTHRIETEIPEHIAELETELREVKDRFEAARGDIEGARRERSRMEQELAAADDKLAKYKAQLMQVKTNDEYRAALNEIDFINRHRSELESRILELMELVETRQGELAGLESELQQEDEKIQADRKIHEDERDRLVDQRSGLEREAEGIQGDLPDRILRTYQRIAGVRGGVALTEVREGICLACNMRMRPAVFQQVRRNDKVMTCDSCGRILFYREPAPEPGTAGDGPDRPGAAPSDPPPSHAPAGPASGQGE